MAITAAEKIVFLLLQTTRKAQKETDSRIQNQEFRFGIYRRRETSVAIPLYFFLAFSTKLMQSSCKAHARAVPPSELRKCAVGNKTGNLFFMQQHSQIETFTQAKQQGVAPYYTLPWKTDKLWQN